MKKCKINYILLSLLMIFLFIPATEVTAENVMNVEKHSADEIRERIRNCGASIDDATVYDQTPSSEAPYDPGKLSAETKNSAVTILNNMRYIAGIDATVGLKDEYGEQAQAGSYLNCLNSSLSHSPEKPEGVSDELYSLGLSGASSCNIAVGYTSFGSAIVYGWMEDGDSSNISRVGHRRWILSPGMKYTGFGMAGRYSSMYAFDGWNGYQGYNNIAWPAQNMPVDYFTKDYPWTLSTGNTEDKSNIKVVLTRTRDQKVWQFSKDSADGYFNVDNGNYGMTGCVIFRPDDIDSYVPGDVFQVKIEGLKDGTLSYEVDFFELIPHIHELAATGAKDATCTEAGNSAYWTCTGCGKYFSDKEGTNEIKEGSWMIPAKGHQIVYVPAKEATETQEGKYAYYTCSICNRIFSDEQGTEIIASGVCGKTVYWVLDAKGNLIISGNGEMNDFTARREVTDGIVTHTVYTAPWSLEHRQDVKNILVEEGVISIGDCAFFECDAVKSISLPNSLKRIGSQSFLGIYQVEEIPLSDNISFIGNRAFAGCNALKTIHIPNNLETITMGCFQFSGLTEVEIPNAVKSIADYAFRDTKLEKIVIPDSIEQMGDGIFGGCESLKTVEFQNSLLTFGQELFYGCTSLESITFPRNLKTIGVNAFVDCKALKKIDLPETIITIEDTAFVGAGFNEIQLLNENVTLGDKSFGYYQNGWKDGEAVYLLNSDFVIWGKNANAYSYAKDNGLKYKCLSHIPEVIPAVAATVASTGLTEGSKCIACGEILKEQKVVPRLEHEEQGPSKTDSGQADQQQGSDSQRGQQAGQKDVKPTIPVSSKKTQTMTVKVSKKTVKVSKLKKKARTVKPITVRSAKGTVKYKITGGNKKSKKVLKINSKTGKITVKKKTKKGTYKVKVTVTATGNKLYNSGSKTVDVIIKVK